MSSFQKMCRKSVADLLDKRCCGYRNTPVPEAVGRWERQKVSLVLSEIGVGICSQHCRKNQMQSNLEASSAVLGVQRSIQAEGMSRGKLRLLLFQSAGVGVWDFYAWQQRT